MIHQAYYQSIESPVGFAGLSPGLATSDAKQWTSYLGYEFPRGCVRAEDAPVRYAVVDPPGEYRLVLLTTPVTGSRANKSMTHVLAITRGQYSLRELLGGYGHSTWVKEMPDCPPETLDSLPWAGGQYDLDRDLDVWLRDPGNFALARFVIAGHLSLPASRQLFLAVDSVKVFWAVYAAARLLPRAAGDSLTFATYQHDPTYRMERIVGATAPLPSGFGRDGDRTHDATIGQAPAPPPGSPRQYADLILQCWLDPSTHSAVDTFLAEAAAVDKPEVLDIWLRLNVDADNMSDDELVTRATDPFWADKIVASSDLFFRVICTGRVRIDGLLSWATEPRQREYLDEVVNRLETAIGTGNAADTAAWLDRLQGFPGALAAEGRLAVENLPPTGSAAVCRLLLVRLERIDCKVIAVEDRQAREVIKDIGPVPPEKVARWLVSGYPRELSRTTWLQSLESDALRPHLVANVVSHPNGSTIAANWLRVQADPQSMTEIQSAAIAIVKKSRQNEVTEEVIRALIGNNAYLPRKWIPEMASEFKSWGGTSSKFRSELVAHLTADPDGTIADDAVRDAVLALPTKDLIVRLPERWKALVQLHKLASGDQRSNADEWAITLKVLHEWGQAFPNSLDTKSANLTDFRADWICQLAISRVAEKGDVPTAELVFREWEAAVGPVWTAARRIFVKDFMEGTADLRARSAKEAAVVRAAIIRWAKTEPEQSDSMRAVATYLRELEKRSPSDFYEARECAIRDEWPAPLRTALWPKPRPASTEQAASQNARQLTRNNSVDLQYLRSAASGNSKSISVELWWLLGVVVIVVVVTLIMLLRDLTTQNRDGFKSNPSFQKNQKPSKKITTPERRL